METDTIREVFGDPISYYTRAQAIEDGVLVDVTEVARQVGIKYPVALTAAVYDEYVCVPKALEGLQDEAGRLFDLVWMYRWAVRSGSLRGDIGTFEVSFLLWEGNRAGDERVKAAQKVVTLKAICGPNDDGTPCVTILKVDED